VGYQFLLKAQFELGMFQRVGTLQIISRLTPSMPNAKLSNAEEYEKGVNKLFK
jgi:hypothetical protein